MEKKNINIKLPYELAGKISKKIKEVGFDTITSYVVYVLEQALSSDDSEEDAYGKEEEKNVRERLKELGYL